MNREELKKKVRVTAGSLLYTKGYISPVDLLIAMEKLSPKNYEDWRMGRIPYLEKVCETNLSKLTSIMKELRSYAHENGLKSSLTVYQKWGKGNKIRLRFSKSGIPQIEEAYATHYIRPSQKNTPGGMKPKPGDSNETPPIQGEVDFDNNETLEILPF
jgi:hypothetical protein